MSPLLRDWVKRARLQGQLGRYGIFGAAEESIIQDVLLVRHAAGVDVEVVGIVVRAVEITQQLVFERVAALDVAADQPAEAAAGHCQTYFLVEGLDIAIVAIEVEGDEGTAVAIGPLLLMKSA
jgi:hypothetical protein